MDIVQGGASYFDLLTKWVAMPILAGSILLFLWQAGRSYRLARRVLAGRKWPITTSAFWVLSCVFHNPGHAWSRRKLFDLLRKRMEFLIFNPRPEWYWPLRDDDELYQSVFELNARVRNRDEGRDLVRKARKAARARYRAAVRQWRQDLRENREKQEIVLLLAGELNDALSDVKLYFDTLRVLNPDPAAQIEFLTPVQVRIGFIASQHLLTGLLVRYNEKWGDIIDGFERDTSDVVPLVGRTGARNPALAQAALDFRQIQSFIYHCWLLWGPSVPVCAPDCAAWAGSYTTLQYGYGDENNSIEIVGKTRMLHDAIAALTAPVGPQRHAPDGTVKSRFGAVMAVPASVRGVLQYSSIAQLGPDKIPEALRKSWRGTQDERPVLRLSEREAASEDQRASGVDRDFGGIGQEMVDEGTDPLRSRYYSAYFWIMFVVLREESPGEWVPLHPDSEVAAGADISRPGAGRDALDRSQAIWKAGIPFFEHGNMADAASCAFAKQQLADKALNGIVNLVEAWEKQAGQPFPLRFAYACAIDESNCSIDLALHALDGGISVADLFRARVKAEAEDADSAVGKLMRRGVIDLDFHAPEPPATLNHHAACTLSGDVAAHYARLDAFHAAAASA